MGCGFSVRGGHLSTFILALAFLTVLAALAAGLLKKGPNAGDSLPYSSAGPLFTPADGSFLGVLDNVIGDDYRVFGKVRLSDRIVPEKGLSEGAWTAAANRFQLKQGTRGFLAGRIGKLANSVPDCPHGREGNSLVVSGIC